MNSAVTAAEGGPLRFLDRDHSILSFNERVLDWARRPDVPLLERLRYLSIVSSNLDEFFEVRAAPHLAAARAGDHRGEYTVESFAALSELAHQLVSQQYALYNDTLLPAFDEAGIGIVSHGQRTPAQRRWVREYFSREVEPLLVPVGLDPAHPFPQVANKSLNFIVRLGGTDAFGRDNDIAIVKVPRVLPRLIRMPSRVTGDRTLFVLLSSVIRSHLQDLFPGREVLQFSQFRVTRHSDLAVDEEEVSNLRTALRLGLHQRHYGEAVRLEISASCSDHLASLLQEHFELPPAAIYRVPGPVNLVRLQQVVDLANAPHLLFPAYKASYPQQLMPGQSIFDQLRRRDVIIHQPFERFDGVLDFLREAVNDPQVLAIKQTIYRTGSDSVMMELLREAVRRGKEVTAVVELKARFDEEANINWAEQLESIGAQVVYGVVGLKTHAKMLLVTRREGRSLARYAHLSTGNYNPRTARLYTDISHLTADPKLTADIDHVFTHLASQVRLPRMNRLLLAPLSLQRRLIEKIDVLAEAARGGVEGRIVLKMNALTDEPLMRALVKAGQAGVRIDLIVRGACMLPARVPGMTDNIRVRSVIGRFLEHSRVFYFRGGSEEELYLSSADWMNRNMLRRVELAWPVLDPDLRQRIIDECLVAYLHDARDAWDLMPDGRYQRCGRRGSCQPGRPGRPDGTLRCARCDASSRQAFLRSGMDLILWRHAEAVEAAPGDDDLTRVLTPRGEKEAARMGAWLDRQLPEGARILCSPALRCEQTVLALGRKYRIRPELAPDESPQRLLEAAQWPTARQVVAVVGHQPTLGQVIAGLLGIPEGTCSVRKGAAWWLRSRERDGTLQTVVVAVRPPDMV